MSNEKLTEYPAPEELQKLFEKMLNYIEHPSLGESLGFYDYFHSLVITGKDSDKDRQITLTLKASTKSDNRKTQIQMEANIRKAYVQLKLPYKLKVKFKNEENFTPQRKPLAKYIIAIASGKGGVGKSTVTANLAIALQSQGYKVGVIDADIYGPSLGKMFGVDREKIKLKGQENKIYPHEVYGIKLISFAFLLDPNQAVVWRGPMLGKAIEQFLFQVIWGELDYLLFDLPPGTGDVQLSLAQLVDVTGGIIISTPQAVALQDANRAAQMFLQLKVPLLGVIENMAIFICPHCQKSTDIFSSNGVEKLAKDLSVPFLGSLPIEKRIMTAGEEGRPIALDDEYYIKKYANIINKIVV